ncbi:MAG: DUF3106 domain-containing protein [Acidobacteriaceae bacterium]
MRNTRQGWMPGRWIVSWGAGAGVCLRLLAGLLLVSSLLAGPGAWGQRRFRRVQTARQAPPPPRPRMNGNARPRMNPEMRPNGRPGQAHLPQWLAQHQNLTPQQQENLLRREPGFNRLAPEQQQRILNRLRSLDARTPEQRERTAARNEMFERLSPEQKQDVRGAAQAMAMMPPARQAMMRRAFNDLRQIPPDQRQEILNSARFSHTFTPQERHVLGSFLSIEPYDPR